jgi:hypothetical protein
MHGISMVVWKRVQVGVTRGICIVSSFSKEGRNATTNQHVKTMYGCQWQIKLGELFAGKLMTLPGFRIKFPVADFGDSGPMICNPEERLTIGRRLPSDSQARSDLLATKSVAGVIGVQHALREAPAPSLPTIAYTVPFATGMINAILTERPRLFQNRPLTFWN